MISMSGIITELNDELMKLQVENTKLNSSSSDEVDKLKMEIAKLQAENTELKLNSKSTDEVDKLKLEITNLQEENVNISTELSAAKKTVPKLKAKITELMDAQKTVSEHELKITELEEANNKLSDDLRRIKGKATIDKDLVKPDANLEQLTAELINAQEVLSNENAALKMQMEEKIKSPAVQSPVKPPIQTQIQAQVKSQSSKASSSRSSVADDSVRDQFYKTGKYMLCKYEPTGCAKGSKCTYLHENDFCTMCTELTYPILLSECTHYADQTSEVYQQRSPEDRIKYGGCIDCDLCIYTHGVDSKRKKLAAVAEKIVRAEKLKAELKVKEAAAIAHKRSQVPSDEQIKIGGKLYYGTG